ncbi:ATP-binding protein [Kitasatospora sp. NPDC058478]|uniref:ATP-binding protein n=1 Tax=unclassified Kitasatospora TaxID=2633591 RepID=UPI00364DC7CE
MVSEGSGDERPSMLLMGVGKFVSSVPEDEEPPPLADGWDDLPFVDELMPRLRQAYERLSYAVTDVRDPNLEAVGRGWRHARRENFGIVHVISHGTTRLPHERRFQSQEQLFMVASDGGVGSDSAVDLWTRDAQLQPEPMLLVVDLCRAGRAARVAQLAVVPDDELNVWVIAASSPYSDAYDGAFSAAVADVLEQIAANGLDTDPSLRYVKWDRVVPAIQRSLGRRGSQQQIHSTKVDLARERWLPFFPNPRWVDDPQRERFRTVTPPVREFVADLGAEHFMDRVGSHFVGRAGQLAQLAPWVDDPATGGLTVVTGAPGCGKSALLGALVCAGHEEVVRAAPEIRRYLAAQHPEGVPSPNPSLAAIHARSRDLDAVLTSLTDQWRLSDDPHRGHGEPQTVAELLTRLQSLPTPPPLIFDALDEADVPADLMRQLLIPLATTLRPDGLPVCRLIVGTRRWPLFRPLLELASEQGSLLDLDDVPDDELRRDLETHLSRHLAEHPAYRRPDQRPVRSALAGSIAATLTQDPRTVREWGPFLVARIYCRALDSLEAPVDPKGAALLGADVPLSLPDVLELDLGLQTNGSRLRAVLAAVAWAKGEGFPTEAIAAVAPEFHPEIGDDDVRKLLDAARFYLRTGVENDGSTLYRLFHQGLADYLKANPYAIASPE